MAIKLIVAVKGSAKSGNYGHRGIPGHVGGSAPKGGAITGTGGAAERIAAMSETDKWRTHNLEPTQATHGDLGKLFNDKDKYILKYDPKLKKPALTNKTTGQTVTTDELQVAKLNAVWNYRISEEDRASYNKVMTGKQVKDVIAGLPGGSAPKGGVTIGGKPASMPAGSNAWVAAKPKTSVTVSATHTTINYNLDAPRPEWAEKIQISNSKIPFIANLKNGENTVISDANKKAWTVTRRIDPGGDTADLEDAQHRLVVIPWKDLVSGAKPAQAAGDVKQRRDEILTQQRRIQVAMDVTARPSDQARKRWQDQLNALQQELESLGG